MPRTPSALPEPRTSRSVVLRQASATALPYPDESLDLVFTSLVLHHQTRSEKLEAMREVHRILAPGGEFHLGDFGQPDSRVTRVLSFLTEETGWLTSIVGVLRTIRAVKGRTSRSHDQFLPRRGNANPT